MTLENAADLEATQIFKMALEQPWKSGPLRAAQVAGDGGASAAVGSYLNATKDQQPNL
jgi:hypothetical protein